MTREEAIELLVNATYSDEWQGNEKLAEANLMAIKALQADTVEVVRCKDCRYWQDNQEGHYPNELCPWDKSETPDDDDFCSFGERKDSEID